MIKCSVIFALALEIVLVYGNLNIPVKKLTSWQQGTTKYFHGYCDLPITKKYRIGQVKVNLVLNTPTNSIQIWKLKVSKVNCEKTKYKMYNKYEIHPGVERADFILTYKSKKMPSGTCITNLPSVQTTTTTTTTTPSTTTISTITTSTTTTPTATRAPTTTHSTGNGVYQVPVVKVEEPYGGGSSWTFKAKCTFQIGEAWAPETLPVDLIFNQETSNLQIWRMNVRSNALNGLLYELINKHYISPGTFEFTFMVSYTGTKENYPTGFCLSDISPEATKSTTTTTSSSQTTSTAAPQTATSTVPQNTTTTGLQPTTAVPPQTSRATSAPQSSTTAALTTSTNGASSGTTATPSQTAHNYGLVLEKSILFYEAQQSGDLPDNHRVGWRADSALGDSGMNGEDLTGGWYDAGDGVKFNLPMASSVINLALGLYKWKDSYEAANQLQNMYDSIKWPLDYFLKCWRSSSQIYYAQVGNGDTDHAYWGRPEDMTMSRPAYYLDSTKKGSDVAGATAAALAAGALAFEEKDSSYSSSLLESAESLYSFAKAHQGTYNNDLTNGAKFYRSSEYRDELCVSAALLYKATNKQAYLSDAISVYNSYNPSRWAYDWDDKSVLCDVLLYDITNEAKYKSAVEGFVSSYMPGGSVTYTPCGLAWRLEWGPLRYSANAAFIGLLAADSGIGNPSSYKEWAMSQIHYMLGDNANDFSYVVGYGSSYPLKPHHRASSCGLLSEVCDWTNYNSPNPNPHVLEGALVGGPDQNDYYVDSRDNFKTNEVACDYNAGFQSAVAGLLHFAVNGNLPAAPTPRC